ncbi:MAG: rhodanese-like domain-containing protein [Eubacteriales bacterium]|nr:rhodanese-like domain-containing protein [Eubacteriales bacterium]
MMKKTAFICGAALIMAMATACGNSSTASTTAAATAASGTEVTAPASDVQMQYISAADAKAEIGTDGVTFLDVRKADDYKAGHIDGAVSVDMDAAKEGDFQAGVASMEPIAEEHDDKLILICYSGKRYAQASTNVLSALGYDMSKVYTLEGGMTQWGEDFPGETVAE